MKWIEIIVLRTVDKNRDLLESKIQGLINEIEKDVKDQPIKIYRRIPIVSDLCIHLFHDTKQVEASGSRLGLCLVNELQKFGIVNHGIWIEMFEKRGSAARG
jgi:hypothetical protein